MDPRGARTAGRRGGPPTLFAIASLTLLACVGTIEPTMPDGGDRGRCATTPPGALIRGVPTAAEMRRIVGGVFSSSGTCTGTLVAPDVVLTAAHCVEFKSCAEPACALDATFSVEDRQTAIVEVASLLGRRLPGLSPDTYRADLALLRLATPLDDRAPLALATSWPATGSELTHYGLGCSDRCAGEPSDTLQTTTSRYGAPSSVVCPGDSGGPVIDASGRVLRVASGFRTKSGDDFFGDVVSNAAWVGEVIAQWAARAPQSSPVIDCAAATTCAECAAQQQCGFCRSSGQCVAGSAVGPLDPNSCPGDEWVWNQLWCDGARVPLRFAEATAGACETAIDCATCTRLIGCGWAASVGRCVRGNVTGPRDFEVDPLGWSFGPHCCPSGSASECGDGACATDETCASCAVDCGACPARCGDGACDPRESCESCLEDCVAECAACAPRCGDEWCDGSESCRSCPEDCGACASACGDRRCVGTETCSSCEADCGTCAAPCGDGVCDATETCTNCADDCGECSTCGDGACRLESEETCRSCALDCGSCPAGPDDLVHMTWSTEGELVRLVMLAPAASVRVELDIDGRSLGSVRRPIEGPPVFSMLTRFFTAAEGRRLRARAYDATDRLIASGLGWIDTTRTAGVWIRQQSAQTFDIGLERAGADVRSIVVEADGFALTDALTSSTRSRRGWIRYTFERGGRRAIVVRTYGEDDATMRGALRRTIELP